MQDSIWQRDEIESPCVKICVIHPESKLCIGCGRSGDEIAGWSQMSAEERHALVRELPKREKAPKTRRGRRQPS